MDRASTLGRREPSEIYPEIEHQDGASSGRSREVEMLRARLDRRAEEFLAGGDAMTDQRDRFELIAEIERQARLLAEQRRALDALRSQADRQDARLREACSVLALLRTSRVYRLMRFLGRWGWLERRIQYVLHQGQVAPESRPREG